MSCPGRHRWAVVQSIVMEKRNGAGRRTGRFGLWVVRECEYCTAREGHYAAHIDAPSATIAERLLVQLEDPYEVSLARPAVRVPGCLV